MTSTRSATTTCCRWRASAYPAFDVILPDPSPGTGAALTRLGDVGFRRVRDIVPEQTGKVRLEDVVSDAARRTLLAGRSTLTRRLTPLSPEAVARGHAIGCGWKDCRRTGRASGITLPADPGRRKGCHAPSSGRGKRAQLRVFELRA